MAPPPPPHGGKGSAALAAIMAPGAAAEQAGPPPEVCLWCKKMDYTLQYGPRMLLTCDMCLVRPGIEARAARALQHALQRPGAAACAAEGPHARRLLPLGAGAARRRGG